MISLHNSIGMEWIDSNDYYDETYDVSAIDGNEATMDYGTEPDLETNSSTASASKRGRKNFMTSRLVAALDNAKVSDGMAVHIMIAAAEALGQRVDELVINRSSIHRLRKENRRMESKEIATNFSIM